MVPRHVAMFARRESFTHHSSSTVCCGFLTFPKRIETCGEYNGDEFDLILEKLTVRDNVNPKISEGYVGAAWFNLPAKNGSLLACK